MLSSLSAKEPPDVACAQLRLNKRVELAIDRGAAHADRRAAPSLDLGERLADIAGRLRIRDVAADDLQGLLRDLQPGQRSVECPGQTHDTPKSFRSRCAFLRAQLFQRMTFKRSEIMVLAVVMIFVLAE